MTKEIKRWFLEHQLWELENGEEIRSAAKAAGVRLVDARFKTSKDVEASGKPALRLKQGAGGARSDSATPQPTQAEVEAKRKLLEQAASIEAANRAAAEKEAAAKAAEKQAAAEAEAQSKAAAEAIEKSKAAAEAKKAAAEAKKAAEAAAAAQS